ncbi:probable E3 ubiquitin-protein ligase HERC3 isoform X3 [Rhineura floridana]|uniref:probable E3 ubiquitin-protein ligase HERC3 isoform X3 n=1 Tax=Rhineura floridana TaxID=261503 RepID=UPI002AC80887|nr:probable E3 ubiquitin-protein ligase HERC3 isoform X3 [Rhineura floridana]
MARRSRSRARRAEVGTQPHSPGPPASRSRASLLLFPEAGYHPSLSEEDPATIRQISCGQACLALVKTNRTVIVFDKAEGDGCQGQARNPKHIKLKKNAKVDLLDCEASHLLILSSDGKLSEHRIASRNVKSEPRLLRELGGKCIIQIACGDHHSLALSKGGELFAWGQNEYGQLATGWKTDSIKEPRPVWRLENIPLAKIAAGSAHSMALSVFGTVYSWGKNAFGQLGLGDTVDRYSPTVVKALAHEKIAFISCGGEHSAVLSKDGLVCTFGAGSCGQLGHNSTRNELFPRLVAELFGARVSQVACGRWHTLVYIPELGEVYSFGSGAEGQLGVREKCNRLIPLPLDLTVNGRKFNKGSASEELVKIIAGENQSIVLLLKEKNSYANLNRMLARVEKENVDKWVSNSDPKCWQTMRQDIKLIFSSAACINGSFLEKSRDKRFRTSWEVAVVDMSAVFLFCEKIAAKPKVFTEVINGVKKLLQSLLAFPGSPEALGVFLIVPILLRRQDIQSDHLLNQLAQAIWRLPQEEEQMLESLWSNLEATFFKDLVGMFRKLVSVNLSSVIKRMRSLEETYQDEDFIWPLHVLQMLYEVNCRSGFRIQESNFYIPEVKKCLTAPNMNHIQTEEQVMRRILSKNKELELVFKELTQFPFIFELEDKVFVHQLVCRCQHVTYIMANSGIVFELCVRRQHLIQDTWQCLRSARADWQFLRVHFTGECGIDDGGLSQEFFTILRRELCDPEAQIFRHFEESHLIWFSSQVPAQEDTYFLIGNLFGMALYNSKIAAFPFPLALFKKMANIQPTLEDLKELSPIVGSNLQAVLDEDYEDVIENMMLDFTVTEEHEGCIVDIDLKENGANIPVTKCNRKEYVDAYVNYVFNASVEKQFGDFLRGFKKGCPNETWQMFLPVELHVVLLGHTKYDWEQLEKNAKYSGYEKSDETIKNFWAVFHDLPEENKKNFLAFLTGTDRIPAQGMERFRFTIADSRKEDPDRWYPEAWTCCRVLLLPRYTNRDVLKNMFLGALEHYEKFGLC